MKLITSNQVRDFNTAVLTAELYAVTCIYNECFFFCRRVFVLKCEIRCYVSDESQFNVFFYIVNKFSV